MKNVTSKLLNKAFIETTGKKADKITDLNGNPPSEKNNFLFNEALGDFTGIAQFHNYKYLFRVFPVEDAWNLELTKK